MLMHLAIYAFYSKSLSHCSHYVLRFLTMYLVSKTETFAKLFFIISLFGLLAYGLLAYFSYCIAFSSLTTTITLQDKIQRYPNSDLQNVFKSILLWTTIGDDYLTQFGEGQSVFIKSNCRYVNCYMTFSSNLINGSESDFDAVVLNQVSVKRWKNLTLPQKRSPNQKFIFFSDVAASDNVVCNKRTENYFNWTWSYKLYSNIFRPFIEVKDISGNVVAPSFHPDWSAILASRNESVDYVVSGKTKAVAWVMNACGTKENRFLYLKELIGAMKEINLDLDIYGCQYKSCGGDCAKTIRQYYFYLAYETTRDEDYVTEEVLKAYDNHAVPIVIGGADYTKFLPPGSYIDTNQNEIDNIVGLIEYFVKSPNLYKRFHRWRKYYTITEVERTRGVCELCRDLNDPMKMAERRSYELFRTWWYHGPLYEVCLPKSAEKIEEVLSYVLNATTQNIKI